jgi:hypothetical protein
MAPVLTGAAHRSQGRCITDGASGPGHHSGFCAPQHRRARALQCRVLWQAGACRCVPLGRRECYPSTDTRTPHLLSPAHRSLSLLLTFICTQINALDGLITAYTALSVLRQQTMPGDIIQGHITHGVRPIPLSRLTLVIPTSCFSHRARRRTSSTSTPRAYSSCAPRRRSVSKRS